ncbi:MAG: septum formation protein Maf [Rubrobacter sp.]|nr:septum formation protein Maf [Rubrobacter sp.]
MQFLLASESPRRVELLRGAGFEFETRKSGFPEVVAGSPAETVEANARGKALAAAEEWGGVVLAADTVVYVPEDGARGEILGQAADGAEVRRMLGMLRGRAHEVYTGVAVSGPETGRPEAGEPEVRHVVTRVSVRDVPEAEMEAYVGLGEGVGKAGGYAIQGRAALFVEGIEGDYTSVVGLPLALTSRMLGRRGVRWY